MQFTAADESVPVLTVGAGGAGPTASDADYGRRLARLECWCAGGKHEFWRAVPAGWTA